MFINSNKTGNRALVMCLTQNGSNVIKTYINFIANDFDTLIANLNLDGADDLQVMGTQLVEDGKKYIFFCKMSERQPHKKVIVMGCEEKGDDIILTDMSDDEQDVEEVVRNSIMTAEENFEDDDENDDDNTFTFHLAGDLNEDEWDWLLSLASALENEGVFEQDEELAARLYCIASEVGKCTKAYNNYASVLLDGTGIMRNPGKAVSIMKEAAAAGDSLAMVNLGTIYEQGDDVKANEKSAVRWYKKAMDAGSLDGAWHYARCLNDGIGGTYDKAKATSIYNDLTKEDYPLAFYSLGKKYATGDGCKLDYVRARKLFLSGLEAGEYTCAAQLGILCEGGLGGKEDIQEAIRYYIIAAENGVVEAYYLVGQIYEAGRPGLKKDLEKAAKYYEMGISNGSLFCLSALNNIKPL